MCHHKNDSIMEPNNTGAIYGARHTQAILLFLLIVIGYGMRANLSVGIVAMTNAHANSNKNIPIFNWQNKNVILSSFFWGYVVTQLGASQLAKKFGAKWFLSVAMCICSLFSILIPIMAHLGSWGVMTCRIAQGLAQGFFFPCCHTVLSKWVPPTERSRIGTFVYAGGLLGTVISLLSTGWIAASPLGWPYAFYIYGIIGLLWSALWSVLGRNSPSDHPYIDLHEKNYIQESLGQQIKKVHPTPWKAIISSLPVWAILVATCGQFWGFVTLITNIPIYLNDVLQFNLKNNTLLSAGPYFLFWILSFMFSYISDYTITHRIFSIRTARKVTNSIGLFVPATCLLILGLISSRNDITIPTLVLLYIAIGVNSCAYSGFNVNHMDLSPNHAGTLMGLTNGISNIFSIFAPLVVQFIVTDLKNPEQWAMVFYIASLVYVIGAMFFIFHGAGEVQSWNSNESESEVTESMLLSIYPVKQEVS